VAESLAKRILSLPMFPTITQEQVEYVCSAVMESVQCPTVKA
jgi:dTDP-4-amino-4,6-dideoxygalactose transaminase